MAVQESAHKDAICLACNCHSPAPFPPTIQAQSHLIHPSLLQLHAVVMAMFASIIAPFGGFFASGFKRGFKIKDFGDSIPGHGGMTDRMDCQVIVHDKRSPILYSMYLHSACRLSYAKQRLPAAPFHWRLPEPRLIQGRAAS